MLFKYRYFANEKQECRINLYITFDCRGESTKQLNGELNDVNSYLKTNVMLPRRVHSSRDIVVCRL